MRKDINIMKDFSLVILVLALGFAGCTKDEELEPYTGAIEFNSSVVYDSITDIEGNVYKTLVIDKQTWMAENLRTSTYNDGTTIAKVEDNQAWASTKSAAYCWYNNDEAKFKSTYGALYNYYAVAMEKICPAGWHVPTDEEWTDLEEYLDLNGFNTDTSKTPNYIGSSLASKVGWFPSTFEGAVGNTDFPSFRNKTGFSAIPAGYRSQTGIFSNIGQHANWWSSEGYSDTLAWARDIYSEKAILARYFGNKKNGISVRCIKD